MANCYLCGSKIEANRRYLRRRVQTGDRLVRRGRKGRLMARHTTFGLRVVCSQCAARIDRQSLREQLIRTWSLWAWLALLAIVLWLT